MRFTVVAALFAGAVMAQGYSYGHGEEPSTVFETQVKTITSCGPAVPDCPAETETPAPEPETPEPELETPEPEPTYIPTHGFNESSPYPSKDTCGGVSVKTIATSITTVIPTVIYETVDIPCATATATASIVPTGGYASPSTSPSTTAPVFTGGASSMGVSIAAAAAGIVALLA